MPSSSATAPAISTARAKSHRHGKITGWAARSSTLPWIALHRLGDVAEVFGDSPQVVERCGEVGVGARGQRIEARRDAIEPYEGVLQVRVLRDRPHLRECLRGLGGRARPAGVRQHLSQPRARRAQVLHRLRDLGLSNRAVEPREQGAHLLHRAARVLRERAYRQLRELRVRRPRRDRRSLCIVPSTSALSSTARNFCAPLMIWLYVLGADGM